MNKAWLLLPVVLSIVILGAHFLRYGNRVGVVASVAVLALLFVRRPWAARIMQVVLVLGTLEWLRTLVALAQVREAMGQPYVRMAAILGAVAMLTLSAALVFESRTLKTLYRRDG